MSRWYWVRELNHSFSRTIDPFQRKEWSPLSARKLRNPGVRKEESTFWTLAEKTLRKNPSWHKTRIPKVILWQLELEILVIQAPESMKLAKKIPYTKCQLDSSKRKLRNLLNLLRITQPQITERRFRGYYSVAPLSVGRNTHWQSGHQILKTQANSSLTKICTKTPVCSKKAVLDWCRWKRWSLLRVRKLAVGCSIRLIELELGHQLSRVV